VRLATHAGAERAVRSVRDAEPAMLADVAPRNHLS